jgi:flagellar hook-associated protein 2
VLWPPRRSESPPRWRPGRRQPRSRSSATPAPPSFDDVVTAVNASAAGVTATKVASGVDASGTKLYRLQFSSKTTGAAASFDVFRGTAAEVAAGTASNVLTTGGGAIVKSAADASVTLWKGSPAEQIVTSPTNTFADLLPGVNVTTATVSADPVTIKVARDDSGIAALASGLVNSLSSAFVLIAAQTAVSTTTDATGKTVTTAGVFAGDSNIRSIRQNALDAASRPVDGHSPSEYGIVLSRTGTISFDPGKFAAAMAADPKTTMAAVQKIASRISAAATSASDKYTGTITNMITGDQSSVTSLGKQISDWDTRLASRKITLQRTYSAMEVSLSNMKAQSAALNSQLSAFSTSTTTR